jgi:tRNA threonylcarbamoyl adenosine modification protein (Sua5/YciO/YrdC/YwlC family)
MKILKIFEENPNDRYIDEAVEILRAGGIIIYPTDTLYALGCDALNNQAIERICKIKGLKSDKTNLSIICKDISQVAEYARFSNDDFKLMRRNLPGPFTFILPALSAMRETVDAMELLVADERWPLPKYREMLFVY